MLQPLYTALFIGAIVLPGAGFAGAIDIAAAQNAGLKTLIAGNGDAAPDAAFSDIDGGEHRLSDWQGKAILVNFWATWCAPCREEMPALDALQQELGGEDFEVLTIAAGRNPPEAIRKFLDENDIENLPTLTDPRMELARSFGVVGLPVTVLIDAEGHEVARMMGDADWNSPAAHGVINQLTAP